MVERVQGKAILVSHELLGGDISQGIGFYGIKERRGNKERCLPIEDGNIPRWLRRTVKKEDDNNGTTLLIPRIKRGG